MSASLRAKAAMPDLRDRVSWPPPGLEQLQGDIWPIIGNLGLGGAIMISPLIWASVADQPFWNVGASGSAAAALAAIFIDFVLVAEACTSLSQLLNRATAAARAGYGWRVIALVTADAARDTGQVLNATGEYAGLTRDARNALLSARLRAVAFYLAGVLWLLLSFPVVFVLARLQVVSQGALWTVPLLPCVIMLLLGVGWRLRERRVTRRAQPRVVQSASAEDIAAWQEAAVDAAAVRAGQPRAAQFRRLRWAILAGMITLLAPLLFAIDAALTGPLLELPGLSGFAQVQRQMGMVQALRSYRLPADSAIDPSTAGHALHSMLSATDQTLDPALLVPRRRYAPLPRPDTLALLSRSGRSANGRVVLEVTESQRRALRAVAEHPALSELHLLARAPRSDLVGATLKLPPPADMSMLGFPIPKLLTMYHVCRAQHARATLLAEAGKPGDAELALREVLSVGYLMLDSGVTIMEALVGTSCIRETVGQLESLYALTGQQAKLEVLQASVAGARRAAAVAQAGRGQLGQQDMMEATPELVLSDQVPPSLRWDLFGTFNTFAPCLNMHNALFGLGRDYEEWLEQARAKLVRSPAENYLFDIARHGVFGSRDKRVNICGMLGALRLRQFNRASGN